MVEKRLGPYVLRRALAEGGMATLYLGLREGPAGFRRAVAVKAIKQVFAGDDDFVKMFLDEARIVTRIRHPNVVHIEELGEDAGTFFLVMELVTGISIGTLLTELAMTGRRLRPEAAVAIAMRVAAGLHAAHETRGDDGALLNVVHRDVSPQNVLLSTAGEVKLIDFGIAKARDRLAQTAQGQLKGKLRYMAPEQMRRKDVDRRSDVFALAIVLWEMLTMRRIFHKVDDVEVVKRVLQGDIPPAGAFALVPMALDQLLLACLSPDMDRRPPTAHELRVRLREALPSASDVDDVDLAGVCWFLGRSRIDEMVEASGGDAGSLGVRPPSVEPADAFERLTVPIDEQDAPTIVAMHRPSLRPSQTGDMAPPAVAAAFPPRQSPRPSAPSAASPEAGATEARASSSDFAATEQRPTFGDDTLRRMREERRRQEAEYADGSDTEPEAPDVVAVLRAASAPSPSSTPRRLSRWWIVGVLLVVALVAVVAAVALLSRLQVRMP